MTTQAERLATPLPKRLRTRPRDKRGYPIPFVVWTDAKDQPQFTVNDERKLSRCLTQKLCGLCGKRFDDGYWFVGGPRCFSAVNGAFIDPPMHAECARYALKVCPYLAARHYGRRVGEALLNSSAIPADQIIIDDPAVSDIRPAMFGLGCASAYRQMPNPPGKVFVVDQWDFVEHWRDGALVNAPGEME